jgi:GH24 family phage-related lysozyme (muramidase)
MSLAFNIGVTAFSKSTLVRRLNETPLQFLRWNKFQRKPLAGLTGRRKVEKK